MSIAQIQKRIQQKESSKKNSVKQALPVGEKSSMVYKRRTNENIWEYMGDKSMADGFLAPTGRFYPKTENFHAQTARAILGPEGQTDEPI